MLPCVSHFSIRSNPISNSSARGTVPLASQNVNGGTKPPVPWRLCARTAAHPDAPALVPGFSRKKQCVRPAKDPSRRGFQPPDALGGHLGITASTGYFNHGTLGFIKSQQKILKRNTKQIPQTYWVCLQLWEPLTSAFQRPSSAQVTVTSQQCHQGHSSTSGRIPGMEMEARAVPTFFSFLNHTPSAEDRQATLIMVPSLPAIGSVGEFSSRTKY